MNISENPPRKKATIETAAIRIKKEGRNIPTQKDITDTTLSEDHLDLGAGHVARLLELGAFNLDDFVLIPGKRNAETPIPPYIQEIIERTETDERDWYTIGTSIEEHIEPVIMGRIPWKDILKRDAFEKDLQAQYQLLDAIQQQLSQFPLKPFDVDSADMLLSAKRILMNARAVEAFLKDAQKLGFSFNQLGEDEYIRQQVAPVAVMLMGTSLLEAISRLKEGLAEMKGAREYQEPLELIQAQLDNFLGRINEGQRFVEVFIQKISRPVEDWTTEDFNNYLTHLS